MPPRARPGVREIIEEVIGAEMRAALALLCAQRGIPLERWQTQPDLEAAFTTHAVSLIACELRSQGATNEQAIDHASIRLGVEPSTIHSRMNRHLRYAYPRENA